MKVSFLIVCIFCLANIFSCKKIVQQAEQNAALNIMTTGVWYVQSYTVNNTMNYTSSFNGYVFKFNQNSTVTAINGTDSTTGSWSANIQNQTITANFPNATIPLSRLDSVWTITNSGDSFVVANTVYNNVTANLSLQKQ